jgi:hypothetical protein
MVIHGTFDAIHPMILICIGFFGMACINRPEGESLRGDPICTVEDPVEASAPLPVVLPPPGPSCGAQVQLSMPLNVLGAAIQGGQAGEAELSALDQLIDEEIPGVEGGPWGKPITGPYRSEDGIHFSQDAPWRIGCASVGDIVEDPAGDLWMYYVDTDLELLRRRARAGVPLRSGWAGVGGLGLARSEDGGESFTRMPLVVEGDMPLVAVDPDVVCRGPGDYELYFLGFPAEEVCADALAPSDFPGPHRVYRARSTDLQNWVMEGEVYRSDRGTDPTVWCGDQACWMAFDGFAVAPRNASTFSAMPVMEGFPGNTPDVHRVGGDFRVYGRTEAGMVTATSLDGVNWGSPTVSDLPLLSPTALVWEGEVRAW